MDSQKIILEAVGEILRDERGLTDSQIDELNLKLGDHGILPKVLISQAESKRLQLKSYIDDAIHRKARIVDGKGVPAHYYMKSLSHE